MKHYDVIIVGAGLFGSVFAAEATRSGKSVLVLDQRSHTGGFCDSYSCPETGIEVHRYGTHVFHTSDQRVWEWMNKYTKFYPYRHRVFSQVEDGRVFELPVNLDTFERFQGKKLTPAEAQRLISNPCPLNFETAAVSRVGREIYEALIEGYSRKQWGCNPATLPASIIQRLPVYTRYHSGYFNDTYQGVPEDGYGRMFERMLSGVDVELGVMVDQETCERLRSHCTLLVWTGPIDGFYNYDLGRLGWRGVRHELQVLDVDDYQGCAQMNYASARVPWTRIHEPKHFKPTDWVQGRTVIQTEYAVDGTDDPSYPMRRSADLVLFEKYKSRASKERGLLLGGRLATYAYYDMHQVVAQALHLAKTSLG